MSPENSRGSPDWARTHVSEFERGKMSDALSHCASCALFIVCFVQLSWLYRKGRLASYVRVGTGQTDSQRSSNCTEHAVETSCRAWCATTLAIIQNERYAAYVSLAVFPLLSVFSALPTVSLCLSTRRAISSGPSSSEVGRTIAYQQPPAFRVCAVSTPETSQGKHYAPIHPPRRCPHEVSRLVLHAVVDFFRHSPFFEGPRRDPAGILLHLQQRHRGRARGYGQQFRRKLHVDG